MIAINYLLRRWNKRLFLMIFFFLIIFKIYFYKDYSEDEEFNMLKTENEINKSRLV